MSVVLSKNIRIAMCNSLNNNTNGFGNATVRIYTDLKPENCWSPIHPKCKKLLEFHLPSAENTEVNEEGFIDFGTIDYPPFTESGLPAWFRITAANNDVIMDGKIGNTFGFKTGQDFYFGAISGYQRQGSVLTILDINSRLKFFLDEGSFQNYGG